MRRDPRYVLDPEPEVGLAQILIATALWSTIGVYFVLTYFWSQRKRIANFFADWYFVFGMVVCLTAAVVAVTYGMVR